jgi:hypothetical protein
MDAIIHQIHLRISQRQLASGFMNDDVRHSPAEGTDTCICGHTIIAPSRSTYAPNEVVNHWECSACGRHWETKASHHGGIQ